MTANSNTIANIITNAFTQVKMELETLPAVQDEWNSLDTPWKFGSELDVRLTDGSVLMAVLPQHDGDLWWSGSGTGELFIDPQYSVTHWRLHRD